MKTDSGYWIECVPVRRGSLVHLTPGLYRATIADFPELSGLGLSPDRAITKLRRRLDAIRARDDGRKGYCEWPRAHSRLRPPSTLRAVEGWMSVYLDLALSARNGRTNPGTH